MQKKICKSFLVKALEREEAQVRKKERKLLREMKKVPGAIEIQ